MASPSPLQYVLSLPLLLLSNLLQQHTRLYVEQDPTVSDWLQENAIPTRQRTVGYLRSLLPFLEWLPNYNAIWFLGDLIAGITVGAVVVPQGMAYAKIANLPPEFGLYSSFVGVLFYFAFATSKEYAPSSSLLSYKSSSL